jgi:hypothetical protein
MTENITNRLNDRKTTFESKVKPMLTYVGTLGAILTVIAYIILVIVLIFGFKAQSITQTIIFAVANGVAGVVVMQFLKIQGISFAKSVEANKEILTEYYNTKTKDKKSKSIKYYWITSITKDIALKAVSIIILTTCVIYIVIEGSQNYLLLAMALVNILMFLCFGLLSLTSAYDFFNDEHIPYIKERLKEYYEETMAKDKEVSDTVLQLEIPDMFPDTVDTD